MKQCPLGLPRRRRAARILSSMGLASLHDMYTIQASNEKCTSRHLPKCITTVAQSQLLKIAIGILSHVDEELKGGAWDTKAPSEKLRTLGAGIACMALLCCMAHAPTTSVPQSLHMYHDYVSVTAVASLMRGLLVASRLNVVRMNPVSLDRHYGEEQEDAKRED